MTPASLPAAYIHVPFCRHRCGYCNFTLVAGRDDLIENYLLAIDRELSQLRSTRDVSTLFIGGGTPTHLTLSQLSQLLTTIHRWFRVTPGGEFSVEANPSDIELQKVHMLAEAGVNRVSIGAQSFSSKKLKLLERDHDANSIRECVDAVQAEIPNVSLDLIFAAPGETVAEWERDVDSAIALSPHHLSAYGLTIEQGTTFWNRQFHEQLLEVDDETQREMYVLAIDKLTDSEFEHYEVSNFARSEVRSRHNENYWLGGHYYAAGPGAARYVDGVRSTNHRSTTTYIRRMLTGESPVAESERLTQEDIARERLVFGLRRIEGVDCHSFAQDTGHGIDELVGQHLDKFISQGLLTRSDGRLHLTRDGLIVSDSIWPSFLVP